MQEKNTRESCGVQLHRKLVADLQFSLCDGGLRRLFPCNQSENVLLFPISPTNKQNMWEIPRSSHQLSQPATVFVIEAMVLSVIRRQTWYLADPQCQHQHLPEREIGQTEFQASVQFCFVEANIQLVLLT